MSQAILEPLKRGINGTAGASESRRGHWEEEGPVDLGRSRCSGSAAGLRRSIPHLVSSS